MTPLKPLEIPPLYSGGLIVNYRCSSACGHCLYASSPRREAGYIDENTTRENLSTIRSLGCHSIHIGGGEPFLNFDGLKRVMDVATETGVSVEYVETNSSWFKDEASACARLEALRERGLRTILVSISPFHNAYIPYRKVVGVVEACRQVGMGVFPWIAEFAPEIAEFEPDKIHAMRRYREHFGEDYLGKLVRRYGITLGGRALHTFAPVYPHRPAETVARDTYECQRLGDVAHFHVDLLGNYVPGLCTGLSIRVKDLGGPLDPDEYPILTIIHNGRIRALFEWAVENHEFEPRAVGYISACDLCLDIRSHLVLNRRIASRELQPIGFYEELQS